MCVNIIGQYEKLVQLQYFNPSAVLEENVVKEGKCRKSTDRYSYIYL